MTYNELDPFAAQWLRNLEAAGHIAAGSIDTRSITEIQPNEIDSPQFHAFAGIGVWSHALRVAGYDDAWNVWTGSCPCQPFSQAGRRAAKSDARHLWPEWFRLIRERRPRVVVGEQVASPLGLGWLDSVQADLEGEGYAVGAVDICAAGFAAPHIRQRLYFAAIRSDGLAHHHQQGLRQLGSLVPQDGYASSGPDADGRGATLGMADSADFGRVGRWTGETSNGRDASWLQPQRLRDARGLGHSDVHGGQWVGHARGPEGQGRLGDAGDEGPQRHGRLVNLDGAQGREASTRHGPETSESSWGWLYCRDGKWRPTQPGLQPLAHGAPQRVGRLRAYGNAIERRTATAFLQALKPQVEDFLRAP